MKDDAGTKAAALDTAEAGFVQSLVQLAARDREFIQPLVLLLKEQLNFFKVRSTQHSCWLFGVSPSCT